ncbi:epidermal differentiation-specific protein-like [Colossoma macropomum]|uniref:epidermal differentiation-specific protein-like n=1 Tax=Colossoma macropomum TaxID=42526 RepID=UPI00186509C1|nr:epidermal differentiation-specific protein-like [Colossoma macropomum]
MDKIIVYDKPNFEGLSREFTSNVANLNDENFDDCICSLKVIGNPWVLHCDPNFSGYQYIFEEGEYPTVDWDSFFCGAASRPSSLEVVTEDLEDPQITLYDEPNYKGKSVVLTCETNLCHGSFNDSASSHKVQRGAWVLYQHQNRSGAQMLARASHDMPNYGWFSNRLSHLRPLKSGKVTMTAKVLWDQKKEQVKSAIIDSICSLNSGSHEQTLITELDREYEGSITESFSFGNTTQIGLGAKFCLDVAPVLLSLSNTFIVEKGGSNTRTEKKIVKVSMPTTIPSHTKVTVNVVRKEVEVKVPVELTITSGFHEKTEKGHYIFSNGSSIITEIKEECLKE